MTVYSIGYQGTDLPSFIHVLKSFEIDILLDVRLTPWSRKPGFSKTKFSNALAAAGIEYIHVREAGNPKELREQAQSIEECLRMYRDFLVDDPSGTEALTSILEERRESRICLMCFERLPSECHRSILLDVIEEAVNHETIHIDAAEQASHLAA
jgi:uncharacterized protein (DUF488 family)